MLKQLFGPSALALPVIIVVACSGEQPVQPGGITASTSDICPWPGNLNAEKEEEVFGHISPVGGFWSVELTARDATTSENQPSYFAFNESPPVNFGAPCSTGGGDGHVNTGAEWGWYAFGPFGAQCVSTTDHNQNDWEHHRAEGGSFIGKELHCLNAGRFTVTLAQEDPQFMRPVDFIRYVQVLLPVGRLWVEDTLGIRPPNDQANMDVLVDVSATPGGAGTAAVEISAAQSAYDETWTPVPIDQNGNGRAPSNFWIRFRASTSVPAAGVTKAQLLARYFWRWTTDPTDRSGFANVVIDVEPLVRATRLSTGTRTVLMQLVQPSERPTNPIDMNAVDYGDTLKRPFDIYGPLEATISPNPGATVVQQPIQLSAGGLNGAGSNQYRWDFGDGQVLDFPGQASPTHVYNTAGLKTVTLSKRDAYTFTVTATSTVNVTDPPPTNLTTMGVTTTEAKLWWTIGNPNATTTVQSRVSGTSTWITAGTAAVGQDTFRLTNLTPCTSYDGSVYHVAAAQTVLNLFRTPGGSVACAPSEFTLVQCTNYQDNKGHWFRIYGVEWIQGDFSFRSTYEIGQASTNNPAAATIIRSGRSSTTSDSLGPYLSGPGSLYFWVRHKLNGGGGASAWAPLDRNPMLPAQTCAI